eukprot:scaffold5331_cov85-Skeletonema_dohrnii-CCMP3373.AAC.1
MEECASGMEQRSNYASMKDAQIRQELEECVSGMEQRLRPNSAAVKDALSELTLTNQARAQSISTLSYSSKSK